jgi:hypothetical protein
MLLQGCQVPFFFSAGSTWDAEGPEECGSIFIAEKKFDVEVHMEPGGTIMVNAETPEGIFRGFPSLYKYFPQLPKY